MRAYKTKKSRQIKSCPLSHESIPQASCFCPKLSYIRCTLRGTWLLGDLFGANGSIRVTGNVISKSHAALLSGLRNVTLVIPSHCSTTQASAEGDKVVEAGSVQTVPFHCVFEIGSHYVTQTHRLAWNLLCGCSCPQPCDPPAPTPKDYEPGPE